MAHTAKQRDRLQLCGAKKKNGQKCRAFAGQGTEHFGVGRCRWHLGNSPSHNVNAVKQEAKSRMVDFGESIEIDPATALLGVLHLSAGHLNWIREELATTNDKSTFDAQVLLRMWDEERDRIARISKAALDVGVAEKQIRIAEHHGEQLAALLRAIFYDGELDLTAAQRARLPDVLRHHLGTLAAQPRGALAA